MRILTWIANRYIDLGEHDVSLTGCGGAVFRDENEMVPSYKYTISACHLESTIVNQQTKHRYINVTHVLAAPKGT